MNNALIDAVADKIVETDDVPLPGGHATRWREARAACPSYLAAPGSVGRCHVCLAILGKWRSDRAALIAANKDPSEVPSDNWSGRNWVLAATAWNVQHPVITVSPIPPGQFWRHLLHGMLRVIQRWHDSAVSVPMQQRDQALRDAQAWAAAADEGLADLTKSWGPLNNWPVLAPGPVAGGNPAPGPFWPAAENLLLGRSGPVGMGQMMVCLHVMHARLGLPQPDLDDAAEFSGRVAFFDRLFKLLNNSAGPCIHCQTALTVAAQLVLMPLVGGPPMPGGPAQAATALLKALTPNLPACFGPHRGDPLPPLYVAASFMSDPIARLKLSHAWRLGEILADAVIDPFHVRKPRQRPDEVVPGLLSEHYAWPEAASQYWLERKRKAALPLPQLARPHVQARYLYFRQMHGGRMAATVHDQLPAICGHSHWPLAGMDRPADLCALCFIDH